MAKKISEFKGRCSAIVFLFKCFVLWHSCCHGTVVVVAKPFKPQEWSASNFSSSYQCIATHTGHENLANDHQRWIVSKFAKVLPISNQWDLWRPVRRICIVMLGLKRLSSLSLRDILIIVCQPNYGTSILRKNALPLTYNSGLLI